MAYFQQSTFGSKGTQERPLAYDTPMATTVGSLAPSIAYHGKSVRARGQIRWFLIKSVRFWEYRECVLRMLENKSTVHAPVPVGGDRENFSPRSRLDPAVKTSLRCRKSRDNVRRCPHPTVFLLRYMYTLEETKGLSRIRWERSTIYG